MPQPSLLPFVAPANSSRLFYSCFRRFIGCFTNVSLVWLLFLYVTASLSPGSFDVAILMYAIFNFVSRGVALRMANHSSQYMQGNISTRGRKYVTPCYLEYEGESGYRRTGIDCVV